YDRVPQQEPASVYELLPGGDDPRNPEAVIARPMRMPDEMFIGTTISRLRDMERVPGMRALVLVDGRRAVRAAAERCTGTVYCPLIGTFGCMEWRITGCAESVTAVEAFSQLRIEEARPSGAMPRYFLYTKSADGDYRLTEASSAGEGQLAESTFDALRALTPEELDALERRLRADDRGE